MAHDVFRPRVSGRMGIVQLMSITLPGLVLGSTLLDPFLNALDLLLQTLVCVLELLQFVLPPAPTGGVQLGENVLCIRVYGRRVSRRLR